jgi:hypothetical protein
METTSSSAGHAYYLNSDPLLKTFVDPGFKQIKTIGLEFGIFLYCLIFLLIKDERWNISAIIIINLKCRK